MKLIGAGLPRTGTLSQKVALEILGVGPCYHMVNVLADLDLAPQWRRALDGDGEWEEIFDGFQATVDWPGSFFYRELIEIYPDAKVLLSVRDGDSWARSMRETIWGVLYGEGLISHLSSARGEIDPQWRSYAQLMKEMWQRSGLLSGEGTRDAQMSSAIQRYEEEVGATVPRERLLVWSVTDGWEPLCEFLEVPVPEMPFPHLNDSKEFSERIVDGSLLALQAWRAEGQDEPVAPTRPRGA
jgi:sulfotransferase family protein